MSVDFELIWWLVLLAIMLLSLFFINQFATSCSDCYVEDLDAWTRNYGRLQRRH